MTVKVMMALVMMPVMVMLVMAMIMRPLPLGPLVGLPVGPRNVCGVCRNYEAVPCGRGHWALWWSSPWGPVTHMEMRRHVELVARDRVYLGHLRSSLWGHQACEGCADIARWRRR